MSGKIKKKTLHVNSGIDPPESINKDAVQKIQARRKKIEEPEYYIKGVLSGDRTLLSRSITIIESANPEHQLIARKIIAGCFPYSGKSVRIGITGVPGVGKSSFIESLGTRVTSLGKKLAVLAIDPSSDKSGGSILGDKTRMESLSTNKDSFIRPSPSGGSLGGVARKTRESTILCEAAGFDVIFIETVGVGQSETAVHSMVDFFLLLMLAGAGDELQGIKRGIMEMADMVAITKADGQNHEKALRAKSEYQNALHLFPPSETGWTPRVEICSALEGRGLDTIWGIIADYINLVQETGWFSRKRSLQAKYWMHEFIHDTLNQNFYQMKSVTKVLASLEDEVMSGRKSSYHAANEVLNHYFNMMGL